MSLGTPKAPVKWVKIHLMDAVEQETNGIVLLDLKFKVEGGDWVEMCLRRMYNPYVKFGFAYSYFTPEAGV